MKYKSVVATARGGPEVLEIQEKELREPEPGEARVRILATGVCQDDIAARTGDRPWLPDVPFVPGYSVIGEVDALGEGASHVAVGDRVAALTNFWGYAEYLYWAEDQLVDVPSTLDPAEAVVLVLNYLTAYQVMHHAVQVEAGDKALVVGASGGVGTALLQLGAVANVQMYGLASKSKHQVVIDAGAVPIDYRTQDFVEVIQQAEPGGLDYVFNAMFDDYIGRSMKVLGRGGALVQFGAPTSLSRFIRFTGLFALYNVLPNGKRIKGYGTHTQDVSAFRGAYRTLFELLESGQIKPVIVARFPILEAAKANEMFERGGFAGNIVLVAPELL